MRGDMDIRGEWHDGGRREDIRDLVGGNWEKKRRRSKWK